MNAIDLLAMMIGYSMIFATATLCTCFVIAFIWKRLLSKRWHKFWGSMPVRGCRWVFYERSRTKRAIARTLMDDSLRYAWMHVQSVLGLYPEFAQRQVRELFDAHIEKHGFTPIDKYNDRSYDASIEKAENDHAHRTD